MGVFPSLIREQGLSRPTSLPASSQAGQRPPGGAARRVGPRGSAGGADREVLAAQRESIAAAATTQTAGWGAREERGVQAPV